MNAILSNVQPTIEKSVARMCRERFGTHWRDKLRTQLESHAKPSVLPGVEWVCAEATPIACATSGCAYPARDVDHVSPTHERIVDACLAQLSTEDRKVWLDMVIERDATDRHATLPEGHHVTALYESMTKAGTFQLVCAECHRKATKSRR